MSDNDDAVSETGPEGWTAMFNRSMNGKAEVMSPKRSGRSKSSKHPEQESNWFSGLLGWNGKPPSRKSSLSSDSPSIRESETESNPNDDDVRFQLGKDEVGGVSSSVSDQEGESSVDSDGFPTSRNKAGSGTSSSHDSVIIDDEIMNDYNAGGGLQSVDELPEESRKSESRSSPRKDRLRNRVNFTVNHDATELATVEEDTKVDSAQPPPESVEPANPGSWWQAYIPAAFGQQTTQVEETAKLDTSKKVGDETSIGPVPRSGDIGEQQPGMWGQLFGGSSTAQVPVAPRTLLPQIQAPPDIPASAEINSYFAPPPEISEPPISLLGPRPLYRYEGRLRGWPRGFAPYWSSHETMANTRQSFSQNAQVNGVSALAMFRVT